MISWRFLRVAAGLLCIPAWVIASEKEVSLQGNDAASGTPEHPWRTLTHACKQLRPGDTLIVRAGEYRERLILETSGTEAAGFITVQGDPGALISGSGGGSANLVLLHNLSYVKIQGLELAGGKSVHDGSAIRVTGHASHIELRNNRIHNIRGKDAMGITIYGTNAAWPIEKIIIDGNEIYDCDPARSEALTLNGNVTDFEVTNNVVHDLNNIGIDFIGGETSICIDRTKVARNGLCKGNKVWRCRSRYEGGYAAGIYVDGGRDIVVEDNIVTECDLGLEVGAENPGQIVSGITVRNNLLYHNDKAGLVFGGFEKSAGRVRQCKFLNNTCYENSRHRKVHNGELWMQWASDNELRGNIFVADLKSPLVQIDEGGVTGNALSRNRYYSPAGLAEARFVWPDKNIKGFESWQLMSKQDGDSTFGPVDVQLPNLGGQ